MTEPPVSSDTAAPSHLVASSHPSSRRMSGRRPNHPTATVPPAHLTASLTDLSYMVTRVHAIRDRGGMARDLDLRLTGVIAEVESLIHDLVHDSRPATNGAKTSPTRVASSDTAGGSGKIRAEAAFEAWLTSDDKPDEWQVDGPDAPPTSLTGILGQVVLSRRQLPADAAAELGMPPGAPLGHAATELILAVNDPVGPRCRSYRSALYYMRDHDDTFIDQ